MPLRYRGDTWRHTEMSDSNPAPKLIRRAEVQARTGLSVSSIYGRLGSGRPRDFDPDFPRPVPLGVRSVAWLESEVDAWIARQVARRNERPKKPAPVKQPRVYGTLQADQLDGAFAAGEE
ncbi:MAG: AlpA family phage regulatory protein [Burkholderiales bacterium]